MTGEHVHTHRSECLLNWMWLDQKELPFINIVHYLMSETISIEREIVSSYTHDLFSLNDCNVKDYKEAFVQYTSGSVAWYTCIVLHSKDTKVP